MAKPNAMLAKIEAKYKAEYEKKLAEVIDEFNAELEQAKKNYMIQLDMVLQVSDDAALMAIDDVFDVNAYSAEKFHKAHIEYVNKISHMIVVEDADDKEIVWAKATIDKRLLQIVGKDNFVPWEERLAVRKDSKNESNA